MAPAGGARRVVRIALSATLLLLPAVACNSLFGIDPPNRSGEGGSPSDEGCVLNSDCESDADVCLFRVCSPPCAADGDCVEGRRCLVTSEGTACVSAEQSACTEESECPEGSFCRGGLCRNGCTGEAGQCLSDQVCSSGGACRGVDPERDPLPGPEQLGAACMSEGSVACAAFAAPERLSCNGSEWVEHDACGGEQLCNNDFDRRGQCDDVHIDCQGRLAGESFCDGAVRRTCGPDRLTVDQVTCPSVQHCDASTTPACAVCLPNKFECDGDTLKKCNEARTGFADEKTCTDAPCSASAGDCTEFACGVDQRTCEGDTLMECNDDRSGFTEVDDCGVGLCDNGSGACLACRGTTCADGDTVSKCAGDRLTVMDVDCPSTEPICVGSGTCVECTPTAGCTTTNECESAACVDGECNITPKDEGEPCDDGVCNGEGACVGCNGVGDCGGSTPVCLASSCVECDPNPVASSCMAACSRTPRYCDVDGSYAAATACGAGQYCSAGSCISTELQYGVPTAGGASTNSLQNIAFAQRIQVACRSSLKRVGLVFTAASGQVQFGIYAGTSTAPTTLLGVSSKTNVTVAGAVEAAISPTDITLDPAEYYWIAFNVQNAGAGVSYAATGSARYLSSTATAFANNPSLPTPFTGSSTFADTTFSLYAEVLPNPL